MDKRILSLASSNAGLPVDNIINTRRLKFHARNQDVKIEAIDNEGNGIDFDCFDLNAVGVYLFSDLLLTEGETLELRLTLPSTSKKIVVKGEVVRAEIGEGIHESGMGIAFRNMDQDASKELRRYVAQKVFFHARTR